MTQQLPQLITFTGADDQTPIDALVALSQRYPLEWGVLFSPSQQGKGRYPSLGFVERICATPGLRLAAHVCGGHSRKLLASGGTDIDELLAKHFSRVQVNTSDSVDTAQIAAWANRLGFQPIVQCREGFPTDNNVQWLFDSSGGRGVVPSAWPRAQDSVFSGYAGGHRPQNVAAAVQSIGALASNYWIDMETGVRDAADNFDHLLCQQVCEIVYGG